MIPTIADIQGDLIKKQKEKIAIELLNYGHAQFEPYGLLPCNIESILKECRDAGYEICRRIDWSDGTREGYYKILVDNGTWVVGKQYEKVLID